MPNNLAHLHVMTNHIPVIGIFFGLALLITSFIWKSPDLKRFSLWFFVVLGLATVVVYFTGEPAEKVVEDLAGVAKAAIEEHEDASIFGFIGIEIIAVLSLISLLVPKLAWPERKWFMRVLLVLVLWTCSTMARIAYLGGQIRHTEFSQAL